MIRYVNFRLSTLWHYIAYIDIPDEQANAAQKTEERDQMIQKRRFEKNLVVEQLEEEFIDDVSTPYRSRRLEIKVGSHWFNLGQSISTFLLNDQ